MHLSLRWRPKTFKNIKIWLLWWPGEMWQSIFVLKKSVQENFSCLNKGFTVLEDISTIWEQFFTIVLYSNNRTNRKPIYNCQNHKKNLHHASLLTTSSLYHRLGTTVVRRILVQIWKTMRKKTSSTKSIESTSA